jgi:uncharacterized membrane protein
MTESVSSRGNIAGFGSRLLQPPLLGLIVFGTLLLYKPLAHSELVLLYTAFPGPEKYLAGFLVGLLGFTLVWKGVKKDELSASAMGWLGGAFIWLGWFEQSFHFFAESLHIQDLAVEGRGMLTPGLLVIESSGIIFLAIFVMMGANRETRCRMLMWLHRNLRLTPDKPTTGYRRSYAWVTALETIFVTWFFYLTIILLYDPRLFGVNHIVTQIAFVVFLVWGIYLLVFKMIKYTSVGPAIRYAIPTSNVFWICIEMGSHWNWYTEIWIRPLEYGLPMLGMTAVFVAGAYVALTAPDRGLPPRREGALA